MRSPSIRWLVQCIVLTLSLGGCTVERWSENIEQAVRPDAFLLDNSITLGNAVNTCLASATENWPESFPNNLCYPEATLIDARVLNEAEADKNWGKYLEMDELGPGIEERQFFQTVWETDNSIEDIRQFYQVFFESSGWDTFSSVRGDDVSLSGTKNNTLVVIHFGKDFSSITLSTANEGVERTDPTNSSGLVEGDRLDGPEKIQYALLYRVYWSPTELDGESFVLPDANSDHGDSSDDNSLTLGDGGREDANTDNLEVSEQGSIDSGVGDDSASEPVGNAVKIEDINEAPDILEAYVKEFIELGIVQQKTPNQRSRLFRPNESITRRDYARWLFLANNLFYGDRPSQMLRESDQNADPVFQDILPSDPDFGIIQGLAEAGLITSTLIDPSASALFKPDDALSRENLIAWKAPLDTYNALPDITVENIEQTWGFRDAALIDPSVLSAIWIDSQNGDASNIRRVFGYTRLFQPNKTVTRAEAASVLWSFGSQSEVRTAASLLNDESVDDREVKDN